MVVYLIRHAHAGSRSAWDGPDRDRPLSAKGRSQSRWLADLLADRRVGRILSSPAVRCTQTVEPLAGRLGLAVETSDDLREGADPRLTLDRLGALADEDAALCAHGDLIPEVVAALRADGMAIEGEPAAKKGSVWVLERQGGRFAEGRYVLPPALARR